MLEVMGAVWCEQVIGPLFALFDTNANAAATVPGFDAGIFKSTNLPNPPVHIPSLGRAASSGSGPYPCQSGVTFNKLLGGTCSCW